MTEHSTLVRQWFAAAGAALLMIAVVGCREKGIRVTSEPPGASVWVGDEIWGTAPVEIPVPTTEPVALRVAMPNWEDATLELPPGEIPPDRTVTVKLQRPGTLQLLVESRPAGADVFIDGEFRGKTPMELSGIEPRQTEILFQMKDREQVTKTVDLQNAKGHLRIRAELPSLTAEYYEQKIREEPRLIHHYADLAHHYMLEGRLKDAMNTFQKGVEVVFQNPGIPDASRLWSEIQRVTDKQYDYGDADTVRQARALLRDCLAALYKEYPKNREVMFYANLVYVLDELNERQRAQEVFETAWKLFPGDRVLRRLRQKGFAPP